MSHKGFVLLVRGAVLPSLIVAAAIVLARLR
jgi:hypothetical protein